MLARIITNFTSIYTKILLLYHGHRGVWTDRERERETETDRQTDRQRGGQEFFFYGFVLAQPL